MANLTRRDGTEFLELAGKTELSIASRVYPLADVNQAIDDIRSGSLDGSAVIKI